MSRTACGCCVGRRLSRIVGLSTIAGLVAASGAEAEVSGALPKLPPELEPVRTALAKYQDPVVAVRDGYF